MADALGKGREAFVRRAWADAYRWLASADDSTPLQADDLERLAVAAYLIRREHESLTAYERAHQQALHAGDDGRAARHAFWIGLSLLFRGEPAQASGWLARADRLLGRRECVERGYLKLPASEQQLRSDRCDEAFATAAEAAAIGERFRDADLTAAARHLQGRARILGGDARAGLTLLDEAMVSVTAGELSPIMTGLIYCSVIEACQLAYALDRAREWTTALARWCAGQPELVAFTATCLVRRAEILQAHGEWPEALQEARHACVGEAPGGRAPAAAFYQQGEVHRLQGAYDEADEAYRQAGEGGCDPQPGLALLRLAQGRTGAAAAAIRRAVATAPGALARSRLLPACVEILLGVGEAEEARRAGRDLEDVAAQFDMPVLSAAAAHARGSIDLAAGDARSALASLRTAWHTFEQSEMPYDAARTRVLMGLACRALGDEDGSVMELEASRRIFERLGAAPDAARAGAHLLGETTPGPGAGHGPRLTPREIQVLRLVASGKTNKRIARDLQLSERTVDRHVSNIFTKLDVPTRAAATAYAYEHELI